ncbi:hypothetical protein D3C85_1331900 [compost metagenome]
MAADFNSKALRAVRTLSRVATPRGLQATHASVCPITDRPSPIWQIADHLPEWPVAFLAGHGCGDTVDKQDTEAQGVCDA